MVGLCVRVECDDSGCLVLRSTDEEVATVVPFESFDCIRVAVEALYQAKLLLLPLPHQQSTSVVQSHQIAMRGVCEDIEVGIFVADELPHSRLD